MKRHGFLGVPPASFSKYARKIKAHDGPRGRLALAGNGSERRKESQLVPLFEATQ